MELEKSLKEKTPKQMRTLRNQLNNRIKSFEDELGFGKKLATISASHTLFGLTLKDCKELLVKTKTVLKSQKNNDHEDD
jgi:ribosomal protein L7/L12